MGFVKLVQAGALRVENVLSDVAVAPAAIVFGLLPKSRGPIGGGPALAEYMAGMALAMVVTAPWFYTFACAVWGIRAVFRTSEVRKE